MDVMKLLMEMTQKFDPEKVLLIERFDADKIITAVYADMKMLQYNVKRFKIETSTLKTNFCLLKKEKGTIWNV